MQAIYAEDRLPDMYAQLSGRSTRRLSENRNFFSD